MRSILTSAELRSGTAIARRERMTVTVPGSDHAALTNFNRAHPLAPRNSPRRNTAVRGPGQPQRSGGGLREGGRGERPTLRLVRGGCEGNSAEERLQVGGLQY